VISCCKGCVDSKSHGDLQRKHLTCFTLDGHTVVVAIAGALATGKSAASPKPPAHATTTFPAGSSGVGLNYRGSSEQCSAWINDKRIIYLLEKKSYTKYRLTATPSPI